MIFIVFPVSSVSVYTALGTVALQLFIQLLYIGLFRVQLLFQFMDLMIVSIVMFQ